MNKIQRAVLMSILCSAVFTGQALAIENNVHIDDNTHSLSFVDAEFGNQDVGGSALVISGINDKNISFINNSKHGDLSVYLGANDSTGILHSSTGSTSISGTVWVNGYIYSSDSDESYSRLVGIKNQSGTLNFLDDVLSSNPIQNQVGANLNFKQNLEVFCGLGNTVDVLAGVINQGNMVVEGSTYINMYNDNVDVSDSPSFYDDYSNLYAIDNRGVLKSTTDSGDYIHGNIIHREGAITEITLKNNKVMESGYSSLQGNIFGSNSDFHLYIEEGGLWEPRHQEGAVEGVCLNGGVINLSVDNYTYFGDVLAYDWNNDFDRLTLKNFQTNGIGYLFLSTDLVNNIGDKYEFIGTTPDAPVNLVIVNKNDNNGTPITKEDGYSVTVASAPSDSTMKINSHLSFYETTDEGSYKYNPIVDEVVEGNLKNWNFVGWEKSGSKNVVSELKQQENDPNINIIDIDNTLKRLNDIRTDPSEVGVWIRGERGKTKISSYGYEYSLTSGGYDWIHENDNANIFAGVGISYSQNDCDTGIIGDTKSLGFNLYGSWYGKKNHDYVDVIVKYGRLDKDYAGFDTNGVFVSGDYDKDLFSVAAKYGRRFAQKNGWYYEPFAGLTWGRVGSADFMDSQNVRIHADSTTSKIAMLGMQVGTNVKGMEYYGKVEVRHDFDGKMHVSAPDSTLPGAHAYEDMGSTWCKLAVGASRKINSNNSFYLDLEKDFGNKVKKPYAVSFGYRYTW